MAEVGSKVMYLYVITNLVNGKKYVGIARNTRRRFNEHLYGHGSPLVKAAAKKYGKDSLFMEVVCCGEDDFIKRLEQRVIARLQTHGKRGYNLSDGGEGNTGWVPTPEQRAKMRARQPTMLGKSHSTETRKLIATKHERAVRIGAEVFPSRKAAIAHFASRLRLTDGCVAARIQHAKKTGDWSSFQLSSGDLRGRAKARQKAAVSKPVTIEGVHYETMQAAATAYGFPSQFTLTKRLHVCKEVGNYACLRMSDSEFRSYRCKKNRVIEIDGVVYPSVKAAAIATGVNYSTLRDRVRRSSLAARQEPEHRRAG